jgi:hypothetical protein
MRNAFLTLFLISLCACSESDSAIADSDSLHSKVTASLESRGLATDTAFTIDEMPPAGASYSQPSLCELTWVFDGGGGTYEVRELVSTQERVDDPMGTLFTYVQLEGESFGGDTAPVVLRVNGGTLESGESQTGLAQFQVGQRLAVFHTAPSSDFNEGFPAAYAWTVFEVQPDGVVGNADLAWESVSALQSEFLTTLQRLPLAQRSGITPADRQMAMPEGLCER